MTEQTFFQKVPSMSSNSVSLPKNTIFALFLVAYFELTRTKRFSRRVFCAPKVRFLGKKVMARKITVTPEQLAKATRNYQRRAHDRRETLVEIARKTGVSVGVFKRAMRNPSKKLKKQEEATRIRRADPAKTAATIKKDVKHHSYRSVQRARQPVRKKRLDAIRKRKIANFVPAEMIGTVGRRAMKQQQDDLQFFSSQKSSQGR